MFFVDLIEELQEGVVVRMLLLRWRQRWGWWWRRWGGGGNGGGGGGGGDGAPFEKALEEWPIIA
jgi:hypothetical protein